MRGAWRRALAWERGDSCTDPANLLGIHLPCTPLATCDLLGFADALCSALTACNFFLGRQEKVTKKKATPALLVRPGGCGTRGYAPQTVLAEGPRPHSVARRCTRGRNNTPNGIDTDGGGYRCGFHLALCVVEQRRAPGASRATLWARFLLGYFFLARQEEVRPRVRRGTQRVRMAPIVRKNYVPPAPTSSNNPPHCVYGRMPVSARLL